MIDRRLLVMLLLGCGGSAPPSREAQTPPACPSDRPSGREADYRPPTDLPSITLAAPQHCERDSAYIRIERTVGRRRLGIARDPSSGGFNEGCMTLPADPSDLLQCPVINAQALLSEAVVELGRRKIAFNGTGLGPCGVATGDYAAWNVSVGVIEWASAEPAVRIVSELLARYDVAGHIGVAVVGITCGTAL